VESFNSGGVQLPPERSPDRSGVRASCEPLGSSSRQHPRRYLSPRYRTLLVAVVGLDISLVVVFGNEGSIKLSVS